MMSESLAPKLKCCNGVCHGGMLQRSHYVHKRQPNYSFRYINKGQRGGVGVGGSWTRSDNMLENCSVQSNLAVTRLKH